MDWGDAAQLGAIAGALGAALLLFGRSRWPLLAGLALLALAEAGLVLDLADHGHRISPKLVALGLAALVPMGIGAAILVCEQHGGGQGCPSTVGAATPTCEQHGGGQGCPSIVGAANLGRHWHGRGQG